MFRVWTLAFLGVMALLLPLAAPADDWPQFSKDERHTRASTDRLHLPLTDLWWVPSGQKGSYWRGRYYYIASHSFLRWLICVDFRTGVQLWQQPLEGLPTLEPPHLRHIPAVSDQGVVYVHDWARQGHRVGQLVVTDPQRQQGEIVYTEHTHHFMRLFDALTGRRLAVYPPPQMEEEPAARVYLVDGAAGVLSVAGDMVGLWEPVGSFTLSGGTVHTLSEGRLAVVWKPGNRAGYIPVYHAIPGAAEGGVPMFWDRYPVTLSGAGMFATGWAGGPGSSGRRVYTVLNGSSVMWHRDLPYFPGIASSNGGTVYVVMGGNRKAQLSAFDAATGATRWQFPPEGAPPAVARGFSYGGGSGTVNGQPFSRSYAGSAVHDLAHSRIRDELVLVRNNVYGQINGDLVALRQESGAPVWRVRLGDVISMVATAEHLVAVMSRADTRTLDLLAFDLDTGKIVTRQLMRYGGDLSTAEGLLFLTSADGTRALAPAERTFRMAVDSGRLEHYRIEQPEEPAPAPPSEPHAPAALPSGDDAIGVSSVSPALADATVLRLNWSEAPAELLRKARERKALCPSLPLLLSLDWLDATRSRVVGASDGAVPSRGEFVKLCAGLAREVSPDYFDLAPEVNVYLARDPRRLRAVEDLLQEAVQAVKKVSPNTHTAISLNAEVLARVYGRGGDPAFGKLILPEARETQAVLTLCPRVDAVGLTSCPRSAFKLPKLIPYDYFLRLKAQIRKPILITRWAVRIEKGAREPLEDQRRFLRRLIQASYWLNAKVVAYPELSQELGQRRDTDAALLGTPERPALSAWRDLLAWKRVERLSADAGNHPLITP